MSPKEKARELVDYFLNLKPVKLDEQLVIEYPTALVLAKNVALEVMIFTPIESYEFDLWHSVKGELEKM